MKVIVTKKSISMKLEMHMKAHKLSPIIMLQPANCDAHL